MEDIGYILSEAPFLVLIIVLAIKIVAWRRERLHRPAFSDQDRRALFRAAAYGPEQWQFYPRFLLAVFGVLAAGWLQFIALAPLGAAVLTATLVISSAAIVRSVLLSR